MHPFNGSIAKIITIDNYSAKRTVLDIIKSLFTGFHNPFYYGQNWPGCSTDCKTKV